MISGHGYRASVRKELGVRLHRRAYCLEGRSPVPAPGKQGAEKGTVPFLWRSRCHGQPSVGALPATKIRTVFWGDLGVKLGVLLLCLGGTMAAPATAQENDAEASSREYRIKAAYLYQLGRYVEWPSRVFGGPQSPFMIGVFAENPIASNLMQIAQSRKIHDRPIAVRMYSGPSNLAAIHILFVPGSLDPKLQSEIIRQTTGKPILLVGEGEGFTSMGGAISFVIEDNRVRLYIARKVVEQQGLSISAKLLQVGHVVD